MKKSKQIEVQSESQPRNLRIDNAASGNFQHAKLQFKSAEWTYSRAFIPDPKKFWQYRYMQAICHSKC